MFKMLAILGITFFLVISCKEAVSMTSAPKDPKAENPVKIEKPEFDLYLYLNYYEDNKERLLNISRIQDVDIKREDFTGKYLPPMAPSETLSDELNKELFVYLNQESFDSIPQERKLGPIMPTSFRITDIFTGLYIESIITSNTQNTEIFKKLSANMSFPQSPENIWTRPARKLADNEFQISEILHLQMFTAETNDFSYANGFTDYSKSDYHLYIGDSWFNKFMAGTAYTVYDTYTIQNFGSYSIEEITAAQLVLNNQQEYTVDDLFWAKYILKAFGHDHVDLFYILKNYHISDEMRESEDFKQFTSKQPATVYSFSGGSTCSSLHQDEQGNFLRYPKDVLELLSQNKKINLNGLSGFGYTYKPYSQEMIHNFTQ